MKKVRSVVLCVFLSIASMTAFSQFTFGPKVGANFTNILNYTSIQPGMDVGIFFRLGESFYFQPELDYSFRSSSFKEDYEEIATHFKLKTHHLDIPLLFGYKFISNPNFNFRVFIGPRLGILVNSSLKESGKDPLSTAQIGGQLGVGVDVWRFTIDLKYDFSGSKYKSLVSNSWWKQNMFNLAFGFKILKN